ncbi:c-type cytochrome [Sedimenticola sp.]|uniref:c-type cytochrome n=1 Tax=Sedimenticola sp. TaxID=1940285 RepID=UPI003D0E241A
MIKVAALAFASGMLLFAGPVSSADGEAIFKACQSCHTVSPSDPPKFGPPLSGVVGRPCGSVQGYAYSDGYKAACEKSAITWTEEEIHAYLDNPTKYLKSKGGGRSKMSFMLKGEAERNAVIEYLHKL